MNCNFKLNIMKRLILSMLFLNFIFYSCSINDKNESISSNSRLESLLNENNPNSQRLIYEMLNGYDKYNLWIRTLDKMIVNDNLNFSQINLLNELKSKLNQTIFDTRLLNNDEREIFKNIYAEEFLLRSKELFNEEYLYNNLFSLNRILYLAADETTGSNDEDCACNKTSVMTCGIISSYTCKSANCKILSDGCGFLGMFECNGKCE